jgi:glycine dehydrogenase
MLAAIGIGSLSELIDQIVPNDIRINSLPSLPDALSEYEYLKLIKSIASKNSVFKSYIGLGYYNTITPPVILRNLFENPGWYTQYTPYQAEIAQGRLESLLNFQTMITDLTGMDVANASLLDEGTAAAEAMTLLYHAQHGKRKKFFVSMFVFPQTIDVLKTRALPLGIELVIDDEYKVSINQDYFGALLQYPNVDGQVQDYTSWIENAHKLDVCVVLATDLLALALLKTPAEMNADIAIGSAQRFGVPMGFGGPHAAYFAVRDEYKRLMPGRIIGVSIDAEGKQAYRMALQTREQHIRREKATSNICTAQALLANIAAMYAVYHGPNGIKEIAETIYNKTTSLYFALSQAGYFVKHNHYFDTLCIDLSSTSTEVQTSINQLCSKHQINVRLADTKLCMSLDETTSWNDVQLLADIFCEAAGKDKLIINTKAQNNPTHTRASSYLQHPVFNRYHTETEMMRYLKQLENKDLALNTAMIPLGSCTMKLNSASEMMPVSLPEFANIHPFAPKEQWLGYKQIIDELQSYLCTITGFDACSLQPNSGAQGEYAGLLVIKKFFEDRNESHRNICLIPSSAHGTNPASAVMAGFNVVVVKCDDNGNIDVNDLKQKAEQHKANLAALMVTYPSTHGVFETRIRHICQIIHDNGGQVYMDGANMNAQVGITCPAQIGADVNHINLHKTFSIPHGGGGPGMGPICVAKHLAPYLPGHSISELGTDKSITAVSSTAWGSASILLISYGYIRMLGAQGCKEATEYAILNANYLRAALESDYNILYKGENGFCAHEFILDMREFKKYGIEVEDVAKRLMDYGFHAPTVSFPVAGTLMIEPTESEPKEELDRFILAMRSIRQEIQEVIDGVADAQNNVLKNAPHTMQTIAADEWNKPYSRTKAAYPVAYLKQHKFWPSVSRINNTHGDRNLICACPPMEVYNSEGLIVQ